METKKHYTLHKILKGIRAHIEDRIKHKSFWLKVELANINFHSSGHCYLDLVETDNNKIIAQCKGAIWKTQHEIICGKLGNDTKNILKRGNEVLFLVQLQFTEQYGLNVIIKDVDINFSLGALERRKQETINRLKNEGIINNNKEYELPAVIQKLAIIGSPKTAGITDLKKQLDNNINEYCFEYKEFPCMVQGERAEMEISKKLSELHGESFDIIAIVRGGGSALDLDVFNSYSIAKEIALHDIPVFTGIGHETDISVADIVAHTHHKTPTALASFIVERAQIFEGEINYSMDRIIDCKNKSIDTKKSLLQLNIQTLTSKSTSITQLRRGDLHMKLNRIIADARETMSSEISKAQVALETIKTKPLALLKEDRSTLRHNFEVLKINTDGHINYAISNFSQIMDLVNSYSIKKVSDSSQYINRILSVISVYDPDNILTKGYAIPKLNGKLLTNQILTKKQKIEIELFDRILIVSYQTEKQKWKTSIMNKLLKN